jgi:superfamily II DNA or RNA helicase
MKIHLYDKDRYFETEMHFLAYEEEILPPSKGSTQPTKNLRLVAASFVGIPTAVKAIAAGVAEGRGIRIENQREDYVRFTTEAYRNMIRPIGLGDVSHGLVYNSRATVEGIELAQGENESNKAYVLAPDGNVGKAVADHVMARFGLPEEWASKYARMIYDEGFIEPIAIIRNPALQDFWKDLKIVKLTISEKEIIELITDALRSRELVIPPSNVQGVFQPHWGMKDYMLANATNMAKKIAEKEPRHSPDKPLNPAIGTMKRIPFPAQAHMIQALTNTFHYESSVICSADMGCGKSIISCGVIHLLHQNRLKNGHKGTAVLLSAPGITLTKWKHKEILGTLPYAKVQIIQNSADALKLLAKVRNGYKPNGLEIYLVGIDKAKFDAEPYFGGVWKRIAGHTQTYSWHCPDCSRPLYKKEDEDYIPMEWEDLAEGQEPTSDELEMVRLNHSLLPNGLPRYSKIKWKRSKKTSECTYHKGGYLPEGEHECHAKLWRYALKSRGETIRRNRTNISRVLKKTKKWFSLYVCDEVHQTKSDGSGRGHAFAQMVKAAEKNLLLTGTLVNGKSTSVKEILWRTDAKSLLKAGFDHKTGAIEWAERFGKLKQVVELKDEDKGWVTKQKRVAQQPTEEPGINPKLVPQFLLHKTGFLELPDMGLPLVELKEIPIFIDMDSHHKALYNRFHNTLHDECMKRSKAGSKGAWSKFLPATIMYADRPDLGAHVSFKSKKQQDDEDEVGCTIHADALPANMYHAKERELVKLVQKELSEDRGCVIYNNYTGDYDMNGRVQEVLKAHGIDSKILNEPNTDKRAEKIEQLHAEGARVIICNMLLVETGLDLLTWPTIIYNQLNYMVSTVRQSSRRAWRIGQEKECRIYYLTYNGTQQAKQFMRIMLARAHALLTEGRLDKSALAQFGRDEQSALANDLASCFAGSDVVDAWNKLSAKELEGLELVAQAEFKEVLATRMKQLANETRRLCGLPPVHDDVEELPAEEPAVLTQNDDSNVSDLFDFMEQMTKMTAPQAKKPTEGKKVVNEGESLFAAQLDLLKLYEIEVVEIAKQPKRARKQAVSGQLGFAF